MLHRLTHAIAIVALLGGAAARADQDLSERVKKTQADLNSLSDVASGLEHDLQHDDVGVAERLYGLERATVDLLQASAEAKYPSAVQRVEAQAGIRAMLARIYQLQERVQQHTIAELDRTLPGEPGRDEWAREGNDLYRPLYRLGTPQPGQLQKTPREALTEMQEKFAAKGGTAKDFHFLSKRNIGSLPSGKLAEWVQFGEDRVRFTTSGAKHPVIAGGKSVRGAGSMKIYKDTRGRVLLAVVSNSSGNYKPGPGSTEGPVQALMALGVPESHILVTSVIPEEPELVKLLLKSKKTYSDEQIKAQIEQVRVRTAPPPRPITLARLGRSRVASPLGSRAVAPPPRAPRIRSAGTPGR